MRTTEILWVMILLGVIGPASTSARAQAIRDYRVLVKQGDVAVGGVPVSGIDRVLLNNHDELAINDGFYKRIHRQTASELTLVVRSGDTMPGLTQAFDELVLEDFNDAGQILIGDSDNTTFSITPNSLWRATAGNLMEPIFAPNQTIPGGTATARWISLGSVMNTNGHTAFVPRLTGAGINGGNDEVLLTSDSNRQLTIMASEGDLVAGSTHVFNDGSTTPAISPFRLAIDKQNRVSAIANAGPRNERGIFQGDSPGNFLPVAWDGASSTFPGTPSFHFLRVSDVNDAGQYGFDATADAFVHRVYVNRNGNLDILAVADQTHPDLAPGVTMDTFNFGDIGNQGHVTWGARLNGPDAGDPIRTSLWYDDEGVSNLIVAQGMQAPGTNLAFTDLSSPAQVVGDGFAVFGTILSDGSSSELAYWMYHPDEGLHEIARVGDTFEWLPGQFSEISALNGFSGNDLGHVALTVETTDGLDAVLMVDLNTIPEPTTGAVLCLGLVMLMRRGRATIRHAGRSKPA